MALSGLDIYKLLPKTNCRECGFATCLAFAMQLAKKAVGLDKCPHVTEKARSVLEASSQPPVRLITIGMGERQLQVGNETVMFRHEEKFHRPCGIGFIIEDSISESNLKKTLQELSRLRFERVGEKLDINLVALRQKCEKADYIKSLRLINDALDLPLVLMTKDSQTLEAALQLVGAKKPLVYPRNIDSQVSRMVKEYNVPVVAGGADLETLSRMTKDLNNDGIQDIVLDTLEKPLADKLWDMVQIRRQALKKSNRSLGYPVLVKVENEDPFEEALEASTYIAKYAGIVLMKGFESWKVFSLLTLRQNIYTDPQKPLQIEPKLYPIGAVTPDSPVMVTTNFSLSYYTVLGEVEASKVPSYILSVDTEGMSVLTAWAAEKFNAEKITASMEKIGLKDTVSHKKIIIPGYVAVISGDLQEQSGWDVIVGPKEAAGLPSFLKNI